MSEDEDITNETCAIANQARGEFAFRSHRWYSHRECVPSECSPIWLAQECRTSDEGSGI
jgi:hypothetical protein